MASYISYTDDIGSTTFGNQLPPPGDRFNAWQPMAPLASSGAGVEAEALGTGELFTFAFRLPDAGMSFEIREIAQDNVAAALRLIRHLNNGGTVTVVTGDSELNEYTCKKWKGQEPSLSVADPQSLKRTLKLTLKSTTPGEDCVVNWP